MSLSTVVGLNVSATINNSLNLGANAATLSSTFGASLIDGPSAGQANATYWDHRTLAASASESLDLAGALVNPVNTTVTFARIKALIVSADSTNVNNVLLGGAASNAVSTLFSATNDVAVVRPGATLAWIAGIADATGYVVTAATGDLLQIANSGSGTSVGYSIIIIGAAT